MSVATLYEVRDGAAWITLNQPERRNALSEELKVWVKRDGQEYYMDFRRGITQTKLKTLRELPRKETGTTIWFKPDAQIFTVLVYQYKTLAERLRELAENFKNH